MEEDLLQEPDDDHPKRAVVVILAVFFEGGLALLSLLLGWRLGHPPLRHFVWSLEDALWGVVATLPLLALFLAILKWPIGPLARAKHFCENEVEPLLHDSSWSEIGLVSLSVGVSEEMLFRGVFQAALTNWLGVPMGLGLASVLFGLLHPISVPYMVMAAFLGLYLGTVWIVSGNLLTVIVVHTLYDFAALSYLIRIRPPHRGNSDSSS
jgi:membrane protease YdiL (CAAX protease family)